jgi:hypothetical protein
MIALLFTTTGEVRETEVDPTRADILRMLIRSPEVETIDLPELGITILYDGLPDGLSRMNLGGTMLLYAASRRTPVHPLLGDLLVLGRADDDRELVDVPDSLIGLFHRDPDA